METGEENPTTATSTILFLNTFTHFSFKSALCDANLLKKKFEMHQNKAVAIKDTMKQ